MEVKSAKSLPALGFLTAIESPAQGFFGGYLVLNAAGRPLEFHCTAPVKANRAQQILYGPTLASYLLAEQIGQALVRKASQKPPVLLTDLPVMLDLRLFVATPVALVLTGAAASGHLDVVSPPPELNGEDPRHGDGLLEDGWLYVDGPQEEGRRLAVLQLSTQRLAVAAHRRSYMVPWSGALAEIAERLEFAEPFTRIRDAIHEAQQIHHAA